MTAKFISVKDQGVVSGYGLFETIRIYQGVPFLVEEHVERLLESCRQLSFANIPKSETLLKLIVEYISDSKLHSRALRLSITHGSKPGGIAPKIFISDREIPYGPSDYEKGFAAAISSYRRNEYSPIVRHKTFNQLDNIISLEACKEQKVKECIFLNTSGYLAEGSKSNLFFTRGGVVLTPALECGLLPGIIRRMIIHLLREQGTDVLEGRYGIEELYACDECFCTNSLMEVMPVVEIDHKSIGTGTPGRMAKRALSLYREYMERYLVKKIRSIYRKGR